MTHRGFSHIGLSTLDLDKTRAFYEVVLGFKPVVADTIPIEVGGHLRHMFFDVGGGQLIAFLEPNGIPDVPAKYDAGINYLAELVVAIDDLGGYFNLIGLCQGGWMAAMMAARFPNKVNSLVLAGAPIDTDAGNGPIKQMVHQLPISFYEQLVDVGGGLLKGELMLHGWKNMHPEQHYFQKHIDLYEHVDDPAYFAKEEAFERWYENPIDLPGRWYLQAITQLFKENRLAKGEFVGLGRKLNLAMSPAQLTYSPVRPTT
jgi:poly-beta-hydroxyalkanoate depolymerase